MATIDNIVADLRKAIESAKSGKTQAYDTVATVKRVAGNTAWVQIPGGTSETPVQLTIACQPGDTVQVRVGGGRAWLTGNQSAPPTDDTTAKYAEIRASEAQVTADDAHEIASDARAVGNEAKQIAGNTNQYFWHTESGEDTGAHITEKTREAFLADPQNGGGNTIMRSNGFAVRDGLTEVASFGGNGSQIGKAGNPQFEISSTGMEGLNENQMPYFRIRYDGAAKEDILWSSTGLEISGTNGTINLPEDITTDAVLRGRVEINLSSQSETITNVQVTSGFADGEVDNGDKTRAYLYFEISNWDITQSYSFRGEASLTVATGVSPRSITTTITYNTSNRNIVFNTTSSGPYGNIGYSKIDIGGVYDTYMPLFVMGTAYGEVGGYSTVIGEQLQASSENQVVIGKFNNNQSANAFEIGNGIDGSRSNAFAVDWEGNVEAAGSITDGQGYSIPHAEIGTTSISTKTGVLNSHVIARYGHVRMLRIAVQKSSATAAGVTLYQGKIENLSDRPLFSSAYGCGYIGSTCVVASIAESGDIIVRVTGGSVAANSSTWLGITYIA